VNFSVGVLSRLTGQVNCREPDKIIVAEYYVITAENFGNRIKDLLARLQLDDRIITSFNDVTFSEINYRVVNQKINELRIESETFLSDSLKLQ
jgi:hypothetical protein